VRPRISIAAALLFGCAAALWSFTFDPLVSTFDPVGPGTVRTYRLKNEGKTRIAVRVQLLTRDMDETGAERNEPLPDNLFLVYPSRFIIEAGTVRSFKVQWRGGDPGNRERAYRVLAEQVPVSLEEKQGSGISILFRFLGSVYIRSPQSSPQDVVVVSALGVESQGRRGVEIRLRNEGGTHTLLSYFKLALSAPGGESRWLPEEAVAQIEGQNMLPGIERVFFVPDAEAELGTAYAARIEFRPET
jgi:fimbrial chaperone protein